MASAQEWYNVFLQTMSNTGALVQKLETLNTAIGSLPAGLTRLDQDLGGPSVTGIDAHKPGTRLLNTILEDIATAIKDVPGGGSVTTSIDLGPLATKLEGIITRLGDDRKEISKDLATIALVLSDESPTGGMHVIKEAVTAQTAALTQLATVVAAAAGGGGGASTAGLVEFLAKLFAGTDPTVGDAVSKFIAGLADLFVPSAEAAELPPAGTKLTPQQFFEAVRQGVLDFTHSGWMKAARGVITTTVQVGSEIAEAALDPLGEIFEGITTEGVNSVIAGMASDFADENKSVRDRAMGALTRAYKLGQKAHFLAAAVEACHPLHEFGLSNAAAAITDLAGFQPISQAVFRPHLEATITRPMRWQTNAQFRPEIANVNALSDFVRRRTMSVDELRDVLPLHGFDDDTCDRYVETVWRDPTIRDLAIALEDTTVDHDWLRDRVRTAGYDDADADRLTAALFQRSTRGIRDRVRSAAVSAYADGTTARHELEATLDTLGYTAQARALELVTADIQRRRDLVKDGLATYRREYVNDVIDEPDYRLAITALGVDPERIELIVADANATRAPHIAAEEAAQIKAAIREVQTQLVPKARALFELGQISEGQYGQYLIDAGISMPVAAQAVALDVARRNAVLNQHVAGDVQTAIDAVIQDQRDLLTERYRKDLLTEANYRSGLLTSGLARDLVDVMVARENVRKVPAPKRVAATAPATPGVRQVTP